MATEWFDQPRKPLRRIGPIILEAKQTGERSAGNPHAAFDEAGAENVARPRWCDTRRRKSEPTGNTNFGLNRRVSPRPYLRERGGEIPPRHSPLSENRRPNGLPLAGRRRRGRGPRCAGPVEAQQARRAETDAQAPEEVCLCS